MAKSIKIIEIEIENYRQYHGKQLVKFPDRSEGIRGCNPTYKVIYRYIFTHMGHMGQLNFRELLPIARQLYPPYPLTPLSR